MKDKSYVLVIDSQSGALKSKMITSGVTWVGKSLNSDEPNWQRISDLANANECMGVVLTLRENIYGEVSRNAPGNISDTTVNELFQSIATKTHLVLAHEGACCMIR